MALKVTITTLNETYRLSSYTLEDGGYTYEGRIRNPLPLEQIAKTTDQGNPIRSVSFDVNNIGGFVDIVSEEIWGARVTVSVDGVSETWAGKIQNWSQSSESVLSITAVEDAKEVFKKLLPDEVVRVSEFNDVTRDATSTPIPIPFGGSAADPLRARGLVVDRVNFRYLFCVGEIRQIVKVWKDREEISTGFTSYLGTSGQATYPGFVYIEFAADPRDTSGRWPEVLIDFVGLKLDGAYTEAQSRNPARALYHLLTQASSGVQGWGLGVASGDVDTTSFNTAITDCDSVGFKLDGLISDQRAAAIWIDQICKACRGSLSFTGGKWTFKIDKASASAKTYTTENMLLRNIGKGASSERKNRIVADYRIDPVEGRFLGSAVREDATSQAAIGVNEYRPQLLLVRDHAAAGKVADYFSNVEKYGELRIEFATKDFSGVVQDSVITVDRSDLGLSSATFRVQRVTVNSGIAMIEARAYSASYFDTSAGSSTTDPPTDPTIQGIYEAPPAAVSGLSLATGNTLLADGTTVAYVDGSYTAGTGFLFAVIEYGEGASPGTWTNVGVSSDGSFHVQPLKNGTLYTFRVTAKNNGGSATAVTGTITTSSDTTAPGKPATPTLSVLFKNIRVKCLQNASKAADMAGFKVFRHTSNDSAAATEIGWVGCGGNDDGVVFLDEGTAYGATYYYWTKAVDRTGNVSVFSDPAGPVTTSQIVSGDLSAGSICAMHINAAGISADCITAGTICADRITALNGTTGYGGVSLCCAIQNQGKNLLPDPDFRGVPYCCSTTTFASGGVIGEWCIFPACTGAESRTVHKQTTYACWPTLIYPGSSGVMLRSCDATNYGRLCSENMIPVRAGASHVISGYFASYPGYNCPKVYFGVCFFNAAGACVGGANNNVLNAFTCVPSTPTRYSACVVAPATATQAKLIAYNYGAGANSYLVISALSLEERDSSTASPVPWSAGESGTITANRVIAGALRSLNWGASAGSYFDLNAGTFCLGGSSAPKLEWDGTTLTVNGVVCATSGCFSGTITSTAGTIGGWTICNRYICYTDASGNQVWMYNCNPVFATYGNNGTIGSWAMHGQIYCCAGYRNAYGFSVTQTVAGPLAFGAGLVTGASFCLPDSATALTSGCPFFWVGTSTSYMKWYDGLLTLNGALEIKRSGSTTTGEWICLNNTCSSSACADIVKIISCAQSPLYVCSCYGIAARFYSYGNTIQAFTTSTFGTAIWGCTSGSNGVVGNAGCYYGIYGCAPSYGVYGYASTSYPVAGNGAYYNASTRALKTNFEDVEVLPGLRCLCIQKWTWNDQNMRGFDEFIGPVAEDVQAAFRLTFANDGVYQLDGIALKAAQELDACITAQNLCIESLAARLANVESRLSQCA